MTKKRRVMGWLGDLGSRILRGLIAVIVTVIVLRTVGFPVNPTTGFSVSL